MKGPPGRVPQGRFPRVAPQEEVLREGTPGRGLGNSRAGSTEGYLRRV